MPEMDEMLFDALRTWRLAKARESEISLYCVFHDSHLRPIAAAKPTTADSVRDLPAISQGSDG